MIKTSVSLSVAVKHEMFLLCTQASTLILGMYETVYPKRLPVQAGIHP
ncbi:hypothetical protein ANCDUO_11839 [Ancylostoma duodenale]|uniref:Uncharacterized protein n=1 Tax=Ancylostoma duodenale TaxID=51022 RepID=A0A0C2GAF0_9BILA|nr:hypothetical protein ANCDUO_11839 [Ancylostoma duodenale]